MRNFAKLLLPLIAAPMIPSAVFAKADCCTGDICRWGVPYCPEFLAKQQLEKQRDIQHRINVAANPAAHGYARHTRPGAVLTAQYVAPQYYPAQMSGPVIVPPTIVNTQYEHNSSKKSCKESVIDMFLFSVRRTTGDCTP